MVTWPMPRKSHKRGKDEAKGELEMYPEWVAQEEDSLRQGTHEEFIEGVLELEESKKRRLELAKQQRDSAIGFAEDEYEAQKAACLAELAVVIKAVRTSMIEEVMAKNPGREELGGLGHRSLSNGMTTRKQMAKDSNVKPHVNFEDVVDSFYLSAEETKQDVEAILKSEREDTFRSDNSSELSPRSPYGMAPASEGMLFASIVLRPFYSPCKVLSPYQSTFYKFHSVLLDQKRGEVPSRRRGKKGVAKRSSPSFSMAPSRKRARSTRSRPNTSRPARYGD